MTRMAWMLVAAAFAATAATPVAFAQDQKKQQMHKGTPEQGTQQKKAQDKSQKKDATGGGAKQGAAK